MWSVSSSFQPLFLAIFFVSLSCKFVFLTLSATEVLSLHPLEIYCASLASQTHTEQLWKQPLPRRQLCNASHCFALQAEHLICREVLALTNNTSESFYVLRCISFFDIVPLEISVCSIMNTDCFAIGVISVSDASQLLKPEKSAA